LLTCVPTAPASAPDRKRIYHSQRSDVEEADPDSPSEAKRSRRKRQKTASTKKQPPAPKSNSTTKTGSGKETLAEKSSEFVDPNDMDDDEPDPDDDVGDEDTFQTPPSNSRYELWTPELARSLDRRGPPSDESDDFAPRALQSAAANRAAPKFTRADLRSPTSSRTNPPGPKFSVPARLALQSTDAPLAPPSAATTLAGIRAPIDEDLAAGYTPAHDGQPPSEPGDVRPAVVKAPWSGDGLGPSPEREAREVAELDAKKSAQIQRNLQKQEREHYQSLTPAEKAKYTREKKKKAKEDASARWAAAQAAKKNKQLDI
jgi:hypothetical protein